MTYLSPPPASTLGASRRQGRPAGSLWHVPARVNAPSPLPRRKVSGQAGFFIIPGNSQVLSRVGSPDYVPPLTRCSMSLSGGAEESVARSGENIHDTSWHCGAV